MKIFISISLIFFASLLNIICQKETTNWNFGQYAAITFNTHNNEPIFVDGSQLNSWEGCASISDKNGNLLFYTNGVTVWNKDNKVMDGGSGLLGHNSATQSSIAFRRPLSENQYYIFTVDAVESNSRGLNMSIVDMSENGGLGKVTTKNLNIHPKPIERILAIPHANQKDFWVIVHISQTTNYLAYKVDENGVVGDPIISNGINSTNRPTGHTLKSTVDGKRIASTHSFANVIELFDFDNYSGKMTLTNNLMHSYFSWPYGVEFSPDGRFLYASLFQPCRLIQMDVTKKTDSEILQSITVLAENGTKTFYYGTLQLGINGKIYVAQDGDKYLGVIKKPNEHGNDCEFVSKGMEMLNGASSRLGLPTFVQAYVSQKGFCNPKGDELISNGDFEKTIANFTSNLTAVNKENLIEFQNPGTYVITDKNPINHEDPCELFDSNNNFMFIHSNNGVNELMSFNLDVEYNTEYIFSFDFVPISDKAFSNISILVDGYEIASDFLHAEGPCELINYKFSWISEGNKNVDLRFRVTSESPEIFAIDNLSLKSCDCPEKIMNKGIYEICFGGKLQIHGYDEEIYFHSWSPNVGIDDINSPNPFVNPKESTIYTLKLENKQTGCIYFDTIQVNVQPITELEIIGNNYVCFGDSSEIYIAGEFISIEWSTGQTSQKIVISSPGTYSVKCFDENGCEYYGSFDLYWIEIPDIIILGPTSVCSDQEYELEVNYEAIGYLWSSGDTTRKITKTGPGTFTVEVFLSESCSAMLSIVIDEKAQARLEPTIIDLGDACIYDSLSISKEIMNTNDFEITITQVSLQSSLKQINFGPYPTLPITLQQNQAFNLNLQFSPNISNIHFTDTLLIVISEPCFSEIKIPVSGNILNMESKIWISDSLLEVGNYVCIPIYASMSCNGYVTGEFSYNLKLDVNKSIFKPESVKFGTMSIIDHNTNYYMVEVNDIAILREGTHIINYICGMVLLPDSLSHSLNISEFEWVGHNINSELRNGKLGVEICQFPIRKFDIIRVTNLKLKPNVTEGTFFANVISSEVGSFNIIVTNSIGNEIFRDSWVRNSKSEPEENEILLDLTEFPAGFYNIIMISPWSTKTEKVLLVK